MAGGIEADAASGVAFSRHDGIYRSDVLIASCKPGPAYRVPVGSGPGHEARRKETRLLIVATSSDRLFLDRVGRHHCPSPLHRHSQFNMQLSQAPAKGDISTLPAGGHFYFALTALQRGIDTISGRAYYLRHVSFPHVSIRRGIRSGSTCGARRFAPGSV